MANNVKVWLYTDLGTTLGVDVTAYAINVSISRGKSRSLDYYEPGSASISFNNYDRTFDINNSFSPLYTYIRPKQLVRVMLDTTILFSGLVDDWFFTYDVNGEAIASLDATDKSTFFANQYLAAQTFPSELSGARVNRILNDSNVQWPNGAYDRDISSGTQLLDADTIVSATNVLDYLHQIETTEQGQLYVQGSDTLTFKDNSVGINSSNIYATFADNNTGYKYQAIDVSYTSQLLYNTIQATSWNNVVVTNSDESSKNLYSNNQLNINNILYSSVDKLSNLSYLILNRYRNPEYRMNSITVNLFDLDFSTQSLLTVQVPLNSYAKVIFTPNSLNDPIVSYVRIIGIKHEVNPGSHLVTYIFESLRNANLTLDDVEFGKLDYYSLGL